MPPCRIVLDDVEMPLKPGPAAQAVDCLSILDRALVKEGRRVVKARAGSMLLLNPEAASLPANEFQEIVCESAPVPSRKESRCALVTMNIGSSCDAMFETALPSFKEYAARMGADLIVIDQEKRKWGHLFYEKWQMYEALFKYDRLLYVDGDILIAPDCPDLFSFVQPGELGGFVEDDYSDRTAMIVRIQISMGHIGWSKGYVNFGMGVYSWVHRALFKNIADPDKSGFADQNVYNHLIVSGNYPIRKLPLEFNRMDLGGLEGRLSGFIIHYAGNGYIKGAASAAALRDAKTALMRSDWEWLSKNRRPFA